MDVLNAHAGMFFFDTAEGINELTVMISSHVTFCVDSVVPTKKVIRYLSIKARNLCLSVYVCLKYLCRSGSD